MGMDFMCFLPSELLFKIFFYVHVRDALKCREVSRGWNRTIASLTSYWQRVICSPLQVGLSSAVLERYGPHTSLPSLAAAGLRHRKWIRNCGSQIGTFSDSLDRPATGDKKTLSALTRLSGVQSNATASGCFLGHGLILTSPQQSPHVRRLSTVAMKVDDYEPLLSLRSQRGSSSLYNLIVWGRATKDFLLVLLYDGEWLCFSHHMNRVLVSWKSDLSQHRGNPRYFVAGSVTHIGCCDRCFLVVGAEASSIHSSTWNLHVLKIGKGKAAPEVATRRTVLVHLQPNERLVQWLLLSKSSERDDTGFCMEHSLLYQTDTQIVVYRIYLNDTDTRMMIETNRVVIPGSDHHSIEPSTNLHSVISVRLSADHTLLAAMVDPYHLYIWDTKTWDLVTSQEFMWTKSRNTNSSLASIIAVGHLYTVVSTGNENLGFNIHIISTHSGELLNERSSKVNWWRKDQTDFVSLVNEDWLSDMFCFNSPLFVYMNCSQSNELVVSYVQFTQLKKAGSLLRRQ